MCGLSPLASFYFIIIIIIIIIIVVVVVVDDDTYYWVYLSSDHLFQIYYKVRQVLLQSATAFLLQSATGITKCDDYYKVRRYTPKRGGLCPHKFLFGVGATALAPYSAAYDTTFPKLYMTCNSITCFTTFCNFI